MDEQLEYTKQILHEIRSLKRAYYTQLITKTVIQLLIFGSIVWGTLAMVSFIQNNMDRLSNIGSNLQNINKVGNTDIESLINSYLK